MSRGQIVRWMLEECNADYREEIIEYGAKMKSADYLAVNPMGKVPAIKHGAQVITECAAICAYLADAYPAAQLAPALSERAEYYRWLHFASGPLESAITNYSLGFIPNEEQQRMAGYGNYDLVLKVLDDELADKEFIAGGSFSAADVYLGSLVDFGILFGTIKATANFSRYVENFRLRPAYGTAKQKDLALMPSEDA